MVVLIKRILPWILRGFAVFLVLFFLIFRKGAPSFWIVLAISFLILGNVFDGVLNKRVWHRGDGNIKLNENPERFRKELFWNVIAFLVSIVFAIILILSSVFNPR